MKVLKAKFYNIRALEFWNPKFKTHYAELHVFLKVPMFKRCCLLLWKSILKNILDSRAEFCIIGCMLTTLTSWYKRKGVKVLVLDRKYMSCKKILIVSLLICFLFLKGFPWHKLMSHDKNIWGEGSNLSDCWKVLPAWFWESYLSGRVMLDTWYPSAWKRGHSSLFCLCQWSLPW